jgi:hypothetical protein
MSDPESLSGSPTPLQYQLGPSEQAATPVGTVNPAQNYVPLEPKDPDDSSQVDLINSYNKFRLNGGNSHDLSFDELQQVMGAAKGLSPALQTDGILNSPEDYYQQVYKQGKAPKLLINDISSPSFWVKSPVTIAGAVYNTVKNLVVGGFQDATDALNTLNPFTTQQSRDESQGRVLSSLAEAGVQNWNFYTNSLVNGAKELWDDFGLHAQMAMTNDPEKRAALEHQESEILRQGQLRDRTISNSVANARSDLAGLFRWAGMSDDAKTIMLQNAQPTPEQVGVGQILTDPLTYFTGGLEKIGLTVGEGLFKGGIRTLALEDATKTLIQANKTADGLAMRRTALESGIASAADDATKRDLQLQLSRLGPEETQAAAAQAAAQTEVTNLSAAVKKQLDDAAGPSLTRKAAAAGFGGISEVMNATAKGMEKIEGVPKTLTERIMGADASEESKAVVGGMLEDLWRKAAIAPLTGALTAVGHAVGGIPGGIAGFTVSTFLYPFVRAMTNPEALSQVARDAAMVGERLSLGRQTLPFFRGIAEKTTGLTSAVASKLDNQLVYAIPDTIRVGAKGAAIGAATGLVASGGQTDPTMQGLASGGLFATAGGGLGQIGRFNSPATLRRASIGDRSVFMSTLGSRDKPFFNALRPDEQLAVASFALAHPDVQVGFFSDPKGVNGNHIMTDTGPRISINVAGDNPLQFVLQHEIGHNIALHGFGQMIHDKMLGNPMTGEIGAFTHLDSEGKPVIDVDPVTGQASYQPNAAFDRYKSEYNARKLRDLPGSLPENNYGIAHEMFAELHAAQFSDPALVQKMVRGFVPSDLVSANMIGNWFGKLGMGYDAVTGAPLTTGGTQNVRGLVQTMTRYYKERQFKNHPLEFEDGMTHVGPDAWRADPSIVYRNLDGAGILARDPKTGQVIKDSSGLPVILSSSQADSNLRNLTDSTINFLKANPHVLGSAGDNVLKLVTDRNGRQVYRGQVVPSDVFDAITGQNQHNPYQIKNWQAVDGMTRRNDGSMMLITYNTAGKGGRYATLAMKERALVPLYTEISPHTHQVNIQAYDPETMQSNIAKMLRRPDGQRLWDGKIDAATKDVEAYLQNLANDRPGETGIGLDKKGVINAMFGIRADANPYIESLMAKSSVFKTFRIDRMNRVREVAGVNRPVSAKTYEQVRAFQQPRTEPAVVEGPIRAPAELRANSPERQAEVQDAQAKATEWLKGAGRAPDISTAAYLNGDRQLPGGKMTNEGLAEFIKANHEKLDIADAGVRERMAHAMTYDAMDALSKEGNAYGWYSDTVDKSMAEMSKLDPSLADNPRNQMIYKLALAVTSQGQKVHPNAESAWAAYQHWKDSGELPTSREVFGGGTKADVMEKNFAKINDLIKEHGYDKLDSFLAKPMTVKTLRDRYGVGVAGEGAKTILPGAVVLGPKIGSFFGNLMKRFETVTMDLWLARTIHRMAGDMFGFSEGAFRDQVSELGDRINNDEIAMPDAQRAKILRQVASIENIKEGKLSRERAMRTGKAILDWADATHKEFKKKDPLTGKVYSDRTDVNYLAKNIDEGVSKISDDPGGVADRTHIRDVFSRVKDNFRDAGIDISNADLQALIWYREQALFKQAGALQKGSENFDYLDAAHALVRKYGK